MSEDIRPASKQSEQAAMMLRGILNAEGEVLGCEECFELLDRCAELIEGGQKIEDVYPDVKKHLEDCICCVEEFDALLAALSALPSSEQEPGSG